MIATEVAVKNALLRPIVHGLVHSIPTSKLIADLVVERQGFDPIKKLLFESLNNIAGVDLSSFRRPESNQILWEEITTSHKKRNKLVHQAQIPSMSETETAIAVARVILGDIFPALIKSIDLHLHENWRICNDFLCRLELSQEQIDKLRNRINQRDINT
jgi:hypothetical protein